MEVDFENHLYKNWTMDKEKETKIHDLSQKVKQEKEQFPIILSTGDLKKRWKMNSRQSVFNQIKKLDFPEPIAEFSGGQVKLYLEKEIQIYELTYPWITTPESREIYSRWITKNIIYGN